MTTDGRIEKEQDASFFGFSVLKNDELSDESHLGKLFVI